jgi:hypothetical protein
VEEPERGAVGMGDPDAVAARIVEVGRVRLTPDMAIVLELTRPNPSYRVVTPSPAGLSNRALVWRPRRS